FASRESGPIQLAKVIVLPQRRMILISGSCPRWALSKETGPSSYLRSELAQAFPEHPIEGREWMDDVGERLQRSAQLDRQYELAQDLAGTRSDQGRADQDSALAIADQLERAAVKVMDVPSRGLSRVCFGDDDLDA